MTKIRVMQLIAPLSMAGAERIVQMLSSNLDPERFENSICAFLNHRRSRNSFAEAIETQGLLLDTILLKHYFEWRPLRELIKLAKARRTEIFHAHGYRADIMGYLAARTLRIPLVSTVHWSFAFPKGQTTAFKLRFYSALDLFTLGRCDRVIAVSESTAHVLRSKMNNGGNLEIVPNTLDPKFYEIKKGSRRLKDKLGIESSSKVVGYLGRFSEEKGLRYLVGAMPAVLREVPNCHLLLVGGGPLEGFLRRQCDSLGVSHKVHFLNEIDYVRGFYESIDLFVLPSLTEGMPMVLLEAQYFGLPVIVSRVGGVPEIITPGENGLLVDPGDSTELAHNVIRLLENELLAQRMGEANRRRYSGNTLLRDWISRYEDIYLSLVNGK
jgi:glycosyltransferase involved in cell wall biosynthesis